MSICALIVAAGRGQRAGSERPKQYVTLAGSPLLAHTLRRFLTHPKIGRVKVVIHQDDRELYNEALAGLELEPPAFGGATRQQSVLSGLEELAIGTPPEIVLIHDAARPFVNAATIDAIIAELAHSDGAIAAIAMTDSVKLANGGVVEKNIPRENLWRAQTPQGFRFQPILSAHRQAAALPLTDDAAVAEQAGMQVRLVIANEENFKITTHEDLARAERLLAASMMTRFGQGFDVHRFGPGNAIMLCGVEIPHGKKLIGHSDADVALHALTDAILGAIAQGDIGLHFPPSDQQWSGASSSQFLAHAGKLVRAAGGEIINLDLTIICEAPRISPHREAMQNSISRILSLPAGRVSVKATTTEGLGFTGRGEGIAAQASATVRMPQ